MGLFKRLVIPIAIFLIFIFLGAYVYHQIEGWRYLDSVYFVVSTVTTIGYGDFTPQTDAGKIITLFFPFVGIGMAFYFLSAIGRYMFRQQLRAKLREAGRLRGRRGVRRIRR